MRAVKAESTAMCKVKPQPSVLRVSSENSTNLQVFKWGALSAELTKKAPVLMKILKAAAESHQTSLHINPVCMAAAILLKQRNSQMCALQSIVGTLLYAGHAGKKVHISNHYINSMT